MITNTKSTSNAAPVNATAAVISLSDIEKLKNGGIPFFVGGAGKPLTVAAVVVDERDAMEWLRMFERGLV